MAWGVSGLILLPQVGRNGPEILGSARTVLGVLPSFLLEDIKEERRIEHRYTRYGALYGDMPQPRVAPKTDTLSPLRMLGFLASRDWVTTQVGPHAEREWKVLSGLQMQ